MKILISLILTLITFNGIFSQKAKRKEITLPIISYPSDLPVKNITSYFIDVLNEEGESSGLTSDQLQKSIALQSFTFDSENPHLSIFVKGISKKDLNISTTKNKACLLYTSPSPRD